MTADQHKNNLTSARVDFSLPLSAIQWASVSITYRWQLWGPWQSRLKQAKGSQPSLLLGLPQSSSKHHEPRHQLSPTYSYKSNNSATVFHNCTSRAHHNIVSHCIICSASVLVVINNNNYIAILIAILSHICKCQLVTSSYTNNYH